MYLNKFDWINHIHDLNNSYTHKIVQNQTELRKSK